MKRCFYCGRIVPQDEHEQVDRVLGWCFDVGADDIVDAFVHTVGGVDEVRFDRDGNTIICYEDLVKELDKALATKYSR